METIYIQLSRYHFTRNATTKRVDKVKSWGSSNVLYLPSLSSSHSSPFWADLKRKRSFSNHSGNVQKTPNLNWVPSLSLFSLLPKKLAAGDLKSSSKSRETEGEREEESLSFCLSAKRRGIEQEEVNNGLPVFFTKKLFVRKNIPKRKEGLTSCGVCWKEDLFLCGIRKCKFRI